MNRKRHFDIAKGIGIIFVVSGHTYRWDITYIFTTFYMALFFFIGGYFLNLHKKDFSQSVKGHIKHLYIPYMAGSFFFLIFHNLFYSINITTEHLSWQDIIKRGLGIFVLFNEEVLLVPIWFLAVLFICSMAMSIICHLLLPGSWRVRSVICCIIGFAMFVCNALLAGDEFEINKVFCALPFCIASLFLFLALGFMCNVFKWEIPVNWITLVVSAVLGIVFVYSIKITKLEVDIRANLCSNWWLYLNFGTDRYILSVVRFKIDRQICTYGKKHTGVYWPKHVIYINSASVGLENG